MTKPIPIPICAYSVAPDGACNPLPDLGAGLPTAPTDGYVWLHFDLNDPAFDPWIHEVLPLTVAKALLQPETRPRCDRLDQGMILNLRGVNLNPGANPDDMVSIRLWVEDGRIISARHRKLWAVDTIRQQMQTGAAPLTIESFLAELAHGLTKRIEKVSLELVEGTDTLEEDALHNTMRAPDLAAMRQSVIKMRRFVRPQNDAMSDLAEGQVWPLDADSRHLLRETANRATRTLEELDATSDRLQAMQDHLDVLHSATLGRNSYVLSVVAAIFLPLGFLTGLFGINVGGMPLVASAYGFWAVTAGSVLIGFLLFFVFRHLKWL